MAIIDGLRANAANTNARLVSRTVDTSTAGELDLENTNPASGATVVNVQREINSHNAFSGRPSGSAHDATPVWNSNELGTTDDTLKERIEAIDGEFADLSPYVIDASVTERGLVSTGTQSFAGNKTFTGTVTASNLSGANTGDVTLSAIGSTPNANGASLTGQALNLEPASASFGGVVSTIAQTFAGLKTFAAGIVAQVSALIQGTFSFDIVTDSTTTGAAQTLATPTKSIVRLTNASLASVTGITAPSTAQYFVLMNVTGNPIDLLNLAGTAANQIDTGNGADLTLEAGASVALVYDLVSAKWRISGGSGGGGGAFSQNLVDYLGGTSVVTEAYKYQRFLWQGASPTTMTAIDTSALVDGDWVAFVGTTNTNPLTIPASIVWQQNGDVVLGLGGRIEYEFIDGLGLVERMRNGL